MVSSDRRPLIPKLKTKPIFIENPIPKVLRGVPGAQLAYLNGTNVFQLHRRPVLRPQQV